MHYQTHTIGTGADAAPFVEDSFTDTNGTTITAHTGETGATWTQHTSYANSHTINNNEVGNTSGGSAADHASGVPATADYDVEATWRRLGDTPNNSPSICGRMSTSANTFYFVVFDEGLGTEAWELRKMVAGTPSTLGTWVETFNNGETRSVKLEMRGADLKVYIDGVERISANDSSITAKGVVGLRTFANTTTENFRIDDLKATDA